MSIKPPTIAIPKPEEAKKEPIKEPKEKTFYTVYCDRELKPEEKKILKRKFGGLKKMLFFDFMTFHNKTSKEMIEKMEDTYSAIVFNMKNADARAWISRNLKALENETVTISLVSTKEHEFLKIMDFDII